MSVPTTVGAPPRTLRTSISWYLRPRHPLLVRSAALADAITVAGPKGPEEVRRLRNSGFNAPVLFDGCGYAGQDVGGPDEWAGLQRAASADRVLLPGAFVDWDRDDAQLLVRVVKQQAALAQALDATMVLAIDSHWLARRHEHMADVFREADCAVALVLAARADPLALGGAVAGLRWVAQRVLRLSILRSDHGAFGALAFGAVHASIGMATSTRHFATAAMRPHRMPGGSSRVFVRELLDWFRASEIAGWAAAGADFRCHLGCCNGAPLARFLDEDVDATWHNMNALSDFAGVVLDVNPEDRHGEFLAECRAAVAQYGLAGFKGPDNPKAQLTGWVLS